MYYIHTPMKHTYNYTSDFEQYSISVSSEYHSIFECDRVSSSGEAKS